MPRLNKLMVAFAITSILAVPAAEARRSLEDMTCSQARSLVDSRGSIE